MKGKKISKIIIRTILILIAAMVLFVLSTFIIHRVKTNKETEILKEKGYYNPVSVGGYSLNVAKFGNENGKHTIVGLAGLGVGDYSVVARQMTSYIEDDNLVVFVDRAGYGFSDDTDNEMTLQYIVEDYRKALKNAGIEPPYILMPHSIGGAYATYWASKYPEEIEGVVFVDGSELSENAFDDEPVEAVSFGDRMLALLAKLGFSRFVLRDLNYHYPDNYTEEEQYLGDALSLMTYDSIAFCSEDGLIAQNAQDAFNGIVTNDIPKLYICADWGFQTKEELIEYNKWMRRRIEINNLDMQLIPTEYDDGMLQLILDEYEKARQDTLYPYIEKMGNCEVVLLAGDHMIFEQKPDECGEIIKNFLNGLDG